MRAITRLQPGSIERVAKKEEGEVAAEHEAEKNKDVVGRQRAEGEGEGEGEQALGEAEGLPEEVEALGPEEQRGDVGVLEAKQGPGRPPDVPDAEVAVHLAWLVGDDPLAEAQRHGPGDEEGEQRVDAQGEGVGAPAARAIFRCGGVHGGPL